MEDQLIIIFWKCFQEALIISHFPITEKCGETVENSGILL